MSYENTPPPAAGETGANFTLATWDRRVLALLIDVAIMFVGYLIVFVVAAVLASVSEVLGGLVGFIGYLAVLGWYIWQLVIQGQTGGTIGKKKINIRVVRESDGQHIGAGLSIGRALLHVVDSLPCNIGYLWPLWDEKRQTFADKIVKTVVVDDRNASTSF